MKVKIGSYPNRLRTKLFQDYMDKKHGYVDWPSEYSRFEKTLEWLDNRLQDFYNIFNWLWFDRREQKIKVHIDPWDTWSMDYTLAHIVVPMLKQLKETKQGAPFVDDEDVPEELKSTSAPPKENEWDIDDNHFKRWDWVMDEMIFAFESKLEDWDDKFYKYEDDPNEDLGIKLVWKDDEGRKAYQERITNGFRLFGKYYEGLWD